MLKSKYGHPRFLWGVTLPREIDALGALQNHRL